MFHHNPLVAVIIPTFNRAHVIRRALHSVLNQTYRNVEVIVVDDGSTDDTEGAVRSFEDDRLRYLRRGSNGGAPAARNLGIRSTAAPFIAFQDSDDEWLCEKLAKQMECFAQASATVGVVYSGFLQSNNQRCTYYPPKFVAQRVGFIRNSLLHGNFIAMPSVVVRRECFDQVGVFDEKLPRFQDWDLFLRISEHYEFQFVDEPLLVAYWSGASISSDEGSLLPALKMILDKHRHAFGQNRKALWKHRLALRFGRYHVHVRRALARHPGIKAFLRKLIPD